MPFFRLNAASIQYMTQFIHSFFQLGDIIHGRRAERTFNEKVEFFKRTSFLVFFEIQNFLIYSQGVLKGEVQRKKSLLETFLAIFYESLHKLQCELVYLNIIFFSCMYFITSPIIIFIRSFYLVGAVK